MGDLFRENREFSEETRKEPRLEQEYLFWWGSFLAQMPPRDNEEELLSYVQESKMSLFRDEPLVFSSPKKVTTLLMKGFFPSPRFFDLWFELKLSLQGEYRSDEKHRVNKACRRNYDLSFGEKDWFPVFLKPEKGERMSEFVIPFSTKGAIEKSCLSFLEEQENPTYLRVFKDLDSKSK